MKIFNHPFKIILLSFLTISLAGCFESTSHDFWIDNPTNAEIHVTIDESTYQIPAESGTFANLTWGKHALTYNGENIHFFVQNSSANKSFINPTQSTYVINHMIYIDDTDARATDSYLEWLSNTYNHKVLFEIDGVKEEIEVPFSVHNDLFMEYSKASWDYFLNEELPEEVELYSPVVTRQNRQLLNDPNYKAGAFQTTKKKLFRAQDYIKEYLQEFSDSDIKIILDKRAYQDYVPYKIALTKVDSVQGEKFKSHLVNLQNDINAWFQLTDPKAVMDQKDQLFGMKSITEFHKMRQEYHEQFTITEDGREKMDYSFNAAYNELHDQTSVTFGNTSGSISILNFFVVD